jgi:hypothetical protein
VQDTNGEILSSYELYQAALYDRLTQLKYVQIDSAVPLGPHLKEALKVSLLPPSIIRYYHINNWSSYEGSKWFRFKNRFLFTPVFHTLTHYSIWPYLKKHVFLALGIITLVIAIGLALKKNDTRK